MQFGKHFGFDDAAHLAPYLAELGVSHLYASPYLKARPNSPHGYDITDHNSLNPELGDAAAFSRMVEALERNGIKQILDYVPNHMGVGGADNPFWLDILEWGTDSTFANWFDVEWDTHYDYLRGKILVPFLGEQYGAVLGAGHLCLKFDPNAGEIAVWAYDTHKLPIAPSTYSFILQSDSPELNEIAEGFRTLPRDRSELMNRAGELKSRLAQAVRSREDIRSALNVAMERFSGTEKDPASWSRLDDLIKKQHWRATHFRVAADDINYRRFFNISDLAGIRMESREVFAHSHQLVLQLVRDGVLDGLRIDHIDGLFDPKQYLVQLREAAGPALYIVVEKILAQHETLRTDWPVQGTTGYEFCSQVDEMLVDSTAEKTLNDAYKSFTGEQEDFASIVLAAKTKIMENEMTGELLSLARQAAYVARQDPSSADFTENLLRRALEQIVAHFPVYRTYVDQSPAQEIDRRYIRWAVAQASQKDTELDPSVFAFWEKVLTNDLAAQPGTHYRPESVSRLAMKVQQFSGPVMAKGFEDTALFRFNRLAALNEVGHSPDRFGFSIAAFHKENLHRGENWPHTLLSTTTHDTKHAEDARARLAALSLIPEEWASMVSGWSRLLRARRGDVEGTAPPARNDEYLFFQNLIASWPAELTGAHSQSLAVPSSYVERITQTTIKSMREARILSNWVAPNSAYETAVIDYIADALNPAKAEVFLESFFPFHERLALLGMQNSLVQTVLKLTCPGVPDFYQGSELWDLSMVDPDNRRAVDFAFRRELLRTVKAELAKERRDAIRALSKNWRDGAVKMAVIHTLLQFRRSNPELFADSSYQPITVTGEHKEQVCAFKRSHQHQQILVVALTDVRIEHGALQESFLLLPDSVFVSEWQDLLTGQYFSAAQNSLQLANILSELPVAVLAARVF